MKLRGFRIEPGEVEALLLAQESVAQAAVGLRAGRSGAAQLVGYVVPAAGAALDAGRVRASLRRRLPDYMVPSRLVALPGLPLLGSGKVDRGALAGLALPEDEDGASGAGGGAPAGAARAGPEAVVAAIFARVLGLAEVGRHASFFEAGGDSILALRALGEVRAAFPDRSVGIADLFNNPSPAALAEAVTAGVVGSAQVVHLTRSGARPMLYCFPGLMVNTREYGPLVRHLGPDQPATGFVCYSLTEARRSVVTVEDIAATYAEHIRRASAGRPCTLVGWSWGGVLAFEAARMLGRDVDVRLVGMLDVCDLDVNFAVGALPDLAEDETRALERRVAAWLDACAMRAEWEDLLRRMDPALHRQFLAYVRAAGPLPTDGPGIGSREYELWTFIDNTLLYRSYRATPHDCPIRVWLAEDSVARGLNHVDWSRYSARVEGTEIVPGVSHRQIVASPDLHASLARALAAAAR
ncbi:D-alanine--D-alanyl carrier protein ligase [Methylobacterium crusticola]|uniref:D-alanine--D-alanyl carrier protein ligase n=1 Tax=Methylobacterium crusticola TaxID=1697972 RepID=A0ABQ4R9R1_9HYPH|nr:D-alanine--D-alanyl carrier protein ligase [Methylobacterium crusticola]